MVRLILTLIRANVRIVFNVIVFILVDVGAVRARIEPRQRLDNERLYGLLERLRR